MRIQLVNPEKGRNKQAFHIFKTWSKLFREVEIEFVSYGRTDYMFVGPEDFIDKKITLSDSINKGIDFINKYKGNRICLFDPGDSTSLLGSYEVLDNTNVLYLFKNQILNFDEYSTPTPFNKWFWNGDEFNVSYNIPAHNRQRIRLSRWNLGHIHPEYHIFDYEERERHIDICAVYQYEHQENYDYGFRNDLHYTEHRSKPFQLLNYYKNNKQNINFISGTLERGEYYKSLKHSKFAISPYGMGEICYRDFELMIFNVPMIKPSMDSVITDPNIYIPWETYIPVNPDWSNLNSIIELVLNDYDKYKIVSENFRTKFRRNYLISDLIRKWINILQ